MNLPNIITLSRIPALLVIVLCLQFPFPGSGWLVFALFVLSGISDWVDGYIARRYHMGSDFGKMMDALIDKVFLLGVLFALLIFDKLPHWTFYLVLIVFLREWLVTGLRLIAAARGEVLAAEKMGKLKTTLQMVSVGILLLAEILGEGVVWNILCYMGYGSLILATWMTLQSGCYYFLKYQHFWRNTAVR